MESASAIHVHAKVIGLDLTAAGTLVQKNVATTRAEESV